MQEQMSPLESLLTCFFSEGETRFRFLEDACDYTTIGGMVRYKNNLRVIVPYKPEYCSLPFLALMRYEGEAGAFEILYGDRDYTLEIFFCPSPVNRVYLGEWVSAAGGEVLQSDSIAWLHEQVALEEALRSRAVFLRKSIDCFINPQPDTLDRALAIQAKRVEQAVRAQYKQDMAQASKMAARAYFRKDYKDVVRLLRPYEKYLSPVDIRKFMIARSKLTDGNV
ncbi:MAG: hypothetical protein R3D66_00530 [Alphaproteobacteria bacterium]